MKTIKIDPDNIDNDLIREVAKVLTDGGIVALPTETVYGLGGRADKAEVIDRLYSLKKRSRDKPFTFVLSDIDKIINNYFDLLPPFAYRMMEYYWPGPITFIYHSQDDKKIGIRVPSHRVTRKILEKLDLALFLPSANLSGQDEAVSASQVESVFDGNIDLIVDSGKSQHAQASTVVDLTTKPFSVLRKGAVSKEDLINTFIRKRIMFVCTGNSCRSPLAEFLLKKYLSELKPVLDGRYEISSAGVSAFPGATAASNIVSLLAKREGVDANGFNSRRLDRHMILSSDMLITMEDIQSKYILQFEQSSEGRVFNLKKFLPFGSQEDIPDPIGRSTGYYEQVYLVIKKAILELIEWL